MQRCMGLLRKEALDKGSEMGFNVKDGAGKRGEMMAKGWEEILGKDMKRVG